MKFIIVKLIAALTLGLFAAPLTADTQEAGKVYRIGFLSAGGVNLADAYRRAAGYVDRLLRGANPTQR